MNQSLLPSTTSTRLERTSVHRQFTVGQKVIGVHFLGTIVPLTFKTHNERGGEQDVILVLGDPLHEYVPFEDFGLDTNECDKIFTFNIRHFYKCYLPTVINDTGKIGTPYQLNRCDHCDVSLVDCNGYVLNQIVKRSYRVDRFIYKTNDSLQDANPDEDGLRQPKRSC